MTSSRSYRRLAARLAPLASLVTVIALWFAPSASAATYTAQCSNPSGSDYLEKYLNGTNTVNDGDVVKLTGTCSDQSFTISNTHAFTLEGQAADTSPPSNGFDGNASSTSPILSSTTDVKLTIKDLFFENAATSGSLSGAGSAIDISGSPTIEHDTFTKDSASKIGGAVALDNDVAQAAVIEKSTFSGNSASDGGAVYTQGLGPLQVLGNTFTGNSATYTGAYYYSFGGALDIEDYSGNNSSNPITISNNTVGKNGPVATNGNTSSSEGGGVFVAVNAGQTVTLDHNGFTNNQVSGTTNNDWDRLGGGLAFDTQVDTAGFHVVQSHNVFVGNGVFSDASPTTTRAGGGGEWASGVSIRSTADEFLSNQVGVSGTPAPEGGGLGILGTDQSSPAPQPASFAGADDLFQSNSITVPGGWGGAIYTGGAYGNCRTTCPNSTLKLSDSTIVKNSVSPTGGEGAGIWGAHGDSLTVNNSIVFGNTGASGQPEIFGYGSPKYQFSDLCTKPGSGKPLPGPGNICADPKLNAYGAETKSSPTIDKGSNALVPAGLTTDLVGHPRITTGRKSNCPKKIVDMGAYEYPGVHCGAPTGPKAVTKPATGVTSTQATLNGTVNPNGVSTTYYFVYGKTTSYGSSTPMQSAGSGKTPESVSATISGLTPGTTYHFKIIARNSQGLSSSGGDLMFTTPSRKPGQCSGTGGSGGSGSGGGGGGCAAGGGGGGG